MDRASLLVIGDLLIDRTYYTKVLKISPEAPIPVAMLQGDPKDTPGGAGLGAAFSASEGISTIFATHCNLETGRWLEQQFGIEEVICSEDSNIINISKTRYIDTTSGYHLIRVDNDQLVIPPFEDSVYTDTEWLNKIEEKVANTNIAAIVILDYRKGLLGPQRRVNRLLEMSSRYKKPTYVDSRTIDIEKFAGIDYIKLNEKEYASACGRLEMSSPVNIIPRLKTKNLIITKGKRGAEIHTLSHETGFITKASHIPDKYNGSPDVTGCGDVLDISFCYNRFINKASQADALKIAVNRATKFAYEPIETRIKCH